MFIKKAQTQVPINELIANRWSGRAYDPDRAIKENDIITLIEAARWAPSCYGDQPWCFIICDKNKDHSAWETAFSCLAEGNQAWAVNAPVLILAVANSKFSKNENHNRWGQYDTGAASMNLCIQATELDLMVHQMGGFNADKARKVFEIPEQFMPMAMMAVGYQLSLENIPEEMKERETTGRSRNPAREHFFNGKWGRSYLE